MITSASLVDIDGMLIIAEWGIIGIQDFFDNFNNISITKVEMSKGNNLCCSILFLDI